MALITDKPIAQKQKISLAEFLSSPESDQSSELIDGEVVAKVSPKFFHSRLTSIFWLELSARTNEMGRVMIEWSVLLKRNGQDWVPVPDLLYVSYDRLSKDWCEDAPCPVIPELVIEIVSPDQRFNQLALKAIDYLNAGIDRVWIVFPPMRSITIFWGDRPPMTYQGEDVFPDLAVTVEQLFVKARI